MKTTRESIEQGDTDGLADVLHHSPGAANESIVWGATNEIVTHPLHYVSDCVFNGLLTNGREADVAQLLLAHGANVNGNLEHETPLIGAASLGVPDVAQVLIEAGADIQPVAVHGATALHWAAYVGIPKTAEKLLNVGASHEVRCSDFDATPLFWAVQGFSKYGPKKKRDQLGAARILIDRGADLATRNFENASLLDRARASASNDMVMLLEASGAT